METYVVGDLHGNACREMEYLNSRKFPEQKSMTKDDVVIQLGDFGGYWFRPDNKSYGEDLYNRQWLGSRNFTFAFVDGNHENFDLINELPVEEKWGALVHVDRGHGRFGVYAIYHLIRGNVYTINDKRIFVFGGAKSADKHLRTEGKDWWSAESPTNDEIENALNNLEAHGYAVDYVLTHTCPDHKLDIFLCRNMDNAGKFNDTTARFLRHVYENTSFKEWHFGHLHVNKRHENMMCHYKTTPHKLGELDDNGKQNSK